MLQRRLLEHGQPKMLLQEGELLQTGNYAAISRRWIVLAVSGGAFQFFQLAYLPVDPSGSVYG